MINQTISHYKILEKLGEGGMGVVYKAHDTKLNRTVALKFLPRQVASSDEERTRFRTEAQAAAALNHRNIAQIYAIEETADDAFIVMEFIDGEELKSRINKSPLEAGRAVRYAEEIANGLLAAHAKGIVHRDVKSSNIMVTSEDEIKIMDFGLAKIREGAQVTKEGTTIGTVAYMSPEQARGEGADLRSDIWSFGVVLYEMLAGKLPFGGGYEHAVVYSILNKEPEFPELIPARLRPIMEKSLAKDPPNRYQSFESVLADLSRLGLDIAKEKGVASATNGRKFSVLRIIVSLLAVAAIILAAVFWPTSSRGTIESIAVLPLENISGDPEQEYFADGMTNALITDLSKIRALRVISRTSVMQYKGTRESLPDIARELNVDAILEGSVMRSGGQVRINASLVDGVSEKSLWADSYERSLSDVFALQRGIARSIVSQVKVSLTPSEQQFLEGTKKVNPEAYDAYLKGLHFNSLYAPGGFTEALRYLEIAIEKDPTFTEAYVEIANACTGMIDIGPLSYETAYSRGKQAIEKALELDAESARAWATMGQFRFLAEWDWSGAETAYKRSLALNDRDPRILYSYSLYQVGVGNPDEGLRFIEKARSLDPFAPDINNDVAWYYYVLGRYDDAIREYKSNIERYPEYAMSHREISWPYQQKGMFAEAVAESKRAYELDSDILNLAYLAISHVYAGEMKEARRIAQDIESRKDSERVPAYELAVIHLHLGETDEAFQWLEHCYETHEGWPFFVRRDKMLASLKSDPRYAALMKKLGLEP